MHVREYRGGQHKPAAINKTQTGGFSVGMTQAGSEPYEKLWSCRNFLRICSDKQTITICLCVSVCLFALLIVTSKGWSVIDTVISLVAAGAGEAILIDVAKYCSEVLWLWGQHILS